MPDPLNAQAWNRYSYVGNDPLTFADPSGFSWLSHFFHQVAGFLNANPLLRSVFQIGITLILASIPYVNVFVAAAVGAAIITGLSGGKLIDDIKAAAIAGATAVAFWAVGTLTAESEFGAVQSFVENVAGHAGVGCLSAIASAA